MCNNDVHFPRMRSPLLIVNLVKVSFNLSEVKLINSRWSEDLLMVALNALISEIRRFKYTNSNLMM